MSKFLGPIHFWLYNKIQFQEALIDAVVAAAEKEGWKETDWTAYQSQDHRKLDDVIDESNIHGWLQSRIHDAETRYAALVLQLTAADASRLDVIKKAIYDLGAARQLQVATAPEAFHQLDDLLLDGMSCDQINRVTSSIDDRITWLQTRDIHSIYWKDNGSYYYDLRQALIEGLLSNTDFAFSRQADGTNEIARKAA